MSDVTTTTDAQAADVVEPQAGTASSQVDTSPAPAASESSQSPDDASKAAAEARAEAAKYRKRLRELEKQLEAVQAAEQAKAEAELTEVEKASRRAAELEQQLEAERMARRDSLLESSVTAAAARMGFADARDAVALVPRTDLEFGDDGRPDAASVEAALKRLLSERPHLRAGHTAGGSPGNPSRTNPPSETDAQRRARLFGGNTGGLFDPSAAARHGGGVVVPD